MADKLKPNEPKTVVLPPTVSLPKTTATNAANTTVARRTVSASPKTEDDDKRTTSGDRKPISGDRRTTSGDRKPISGDRKPISGDRRTVSERTSAPRTLASKTATAASPPATTTQTASWEKKSKLGQKLDKTKEDLQFKWSVFSSAVGIQWRRFLAFARTRIFITVASISLAVLLAISGVIVYFVNFVPLGFLPQGINIGNGSYYGTHQLMFTDVFKTSTVVLDSVNWDKGVIPVDEKGYPTQVPFEGKKAVFMINGLYEGDYAILYDGDGEFEGGRWTEIVSADPNRVNIKLLPYDAEKDTARERFLTISRSDPANPIKNIRIIPRSFVGKEHKMPLFTADFLKGLKNMHTLRFMDAVNTNGSVQTKWSDRSQKEQFSYEGGVPYEYLISLCNQLKADAWFCVPHMATDDYVANLSKLIKGSLNKKLGVYVEYSNEVWNSGFAAAGYVSSNAPSGEAHVVQALEALGASGANLPQKSAYMMTRVFKIFENEFKGKDRSRLTTVGAVHTNNPTNTKTMINYWVKNQCVPDAISGAGYFGFETSHYNDATIPYTVIPRGDASELNGYFHNKWNADPAEVDADDILDAVFTLFDYIVAPAVYETAALVKGCGARYIVYEGGQHMQPHNQGEYAYNQAVYDSQISPRMYDLYMKNYRLHEAVGCEMFVNFSYVSPRESRYGSWGVISKQSEVTAKKMKEVAPKFAALIEANTRNGLKNKR